MCRGEIELERTVFSSFKCLEKEGFEVKQESRWQTPQGIVTYDIAILFKGILFAIIETKSSLNSPILERTKAQIKAAVDYSTAFYGIITDGKEYYLYTRKQKFEKKTFEEIINFLLRNKTQQAPKTPSEIENLLKKQDFDDTLKKQIRKSFYAKSGTSFPGLLNLDDYLKDILTKEANQGESELYRYVPFDTAFNILKNNTYRMNGIAGMNDKSEGDIRYSISYEIGDPNNIFISSFSTLEDNLTMWRLYGDDAKGVCLVFTAKKNAKNDIFWLYPVSYEDKHKQIIIDFYNSRFKIKNIEKWIYFFKNQHFNTENEVRLLALEQSKKKEWYKTNDSSIINPYIEFDLNDDNFPLELKKIVLGPKCPEAAYNRAQIEAMLNKKSEIEVSLSKIEIYR